MAQKQVKRTRKEVRKITTEAMGDAVTDATLAVVNKYRMQTLVARVCFGICFGILCLVTLMSFWR